MTDYKNWDSLVLTTHTTTINSYYTTYTTTILSWEERQYELLSSIDINIIEKFLREKYSSDLRKIKLEKINENNE